MDCWHLTLKPLNWLNYYTSNKIINKNDAILTTSLVSANLGPTLESNASGPSAPQGGRWRGSGRTAFEEPFPLAPPSTRQKIHGPKLPQHSIFVWASISWSEPEGHEEEDLTLEKPEYQNIYLAPLSLLDFWELIIVEIIVRIHVNNLTFSWCS